MKVNFPVLTVAYMYHSSCTSRKLMMLPTIYLIHLDIITQYCSGGRQLQIPRSGRLRDIPF